MKKYKLLQNDVIEVNNTTLYRIKALVDIPECGIKIGDIGGYIHSEKNLSHEGDCWVYGDAQVFGDAQVYGDAQVFGNARVSGNAHICENADISSDDDYAVVSGFGSKNRTTTFFLSSNKKVLVSCGCFIGYLDEFRAKVLETHGGTPLGQEYLMIADLMEARFNRVIESKEEN